MFDPGSQRRLAEPLEHDGIDVNTDPAMSQPR
jgi:hypothetical protein